MILLSNFHRSYIGVGIFEKVRLSVYPVLRIFILPYMYSFVLILFFYFQETEISIVFLVSQWVFLINLVNLDRSKLMYCNLDGNRLCPGLRMCLIYRLV